MWTKIIFSSLTVVFSHRQSGEEFHLVQHGFVEKSEVLKHVQESAAEYINWNICNVSIYSNLGGLGGNNPEGTVLKAHELRYKQIAKLPKGEFADLVITNTTPYEAMEENPKQAKDAGDPDIGGQWMNGINVCMGRLNIRTPGGPDLKFRMVKSGTDDLVEGDYTYDLTIFDLDESEGGGTVETLEVEGIIDHRSDITPDIVNGGKTYIFKAESEKVDNPTDPYSLTPRQEQASVALVYNTNEWTIKFRSQYAQGETGGQKKGRNFFFAGRSSISCDKSDDGKCEIYQDPHIDGFDNPNQGPFLTRVAIFDSPRGVSLFDRAYSGRQHSWHAGGDPNIDVNVYEKGDFWLVKNDFVQIQARYSDSIEFGRGRSGLAALAVGGRALGGGTLLVEPKLGEIVCFGERIGPEEIFSKETESGPLRVHTHYNAFTEGGVAASGIHVTLPNNIFLQIRRYNTHLDAKITMPRAAGQTDGQCGNFNGDPYDDSLEHVANRMISMSVADKDLLFAKPFSK